VGLRDRTSKVIRQPSASVEAGPRAFPVRQEFRIEGCQAKDANEKIANALGAKHMTPKMNIAKQKNLNSFPSCTWKRRYDRSSASTAAG
jgi:hypothetical protein